MISTSLLNACTTDWDRADDDSRINSISETWPRIQYLLHLVICYSVWLFMSGPWVMFVMSEPSRLSSKHRSSPILSTMLIDLKRSAKRKYELPEKCIFAVALSPGTLLLGRSIERRLRMNRVTRIADVWRIDQFGRLNSSRQEQTVSMKNVTLKSDTLLLTKVPG